MDPIEFRNGRVFVAGEAVATLDGPLIQLAYNDDDVYAIIEYPEGHEHYYRNVVRLNDDSIVWRIRPQTAMHDSDEPHP